MRRFLIAVLGAVTVLHVSAQGLSVSATDTTQTVIAAHKGKRITVRLTSGQELTGVVREATDKVLVLGELAGREYFDAVVAADRVEAVIVRVKQ